MNNKYSVACITLIRDKYTVRLHGAPCSSFDGVTACVVYTADSIRKFDSKSNRTADSIGDSNAKKNDSQVPTPNSYYWLFGRIWIWFTIRPDTNRTRIVSWPVVNFVNCAVMQSSRRPANGSGCQSTVPWLWAPCGCGADVCTHGAMARAGEKSYWQ